MADHKFPPVAFLTLGLLSIAASIIFLVRAAGIEASTERVVSAIAFGALGVLFLVAYWASTTRHRHS